MLLFKVDLWDRVRRYFVVVATAAAALDRLRPPLQPKAERPGAPGRPHPSPPAKEGPAQHPGVPGRPPPSPPAKEGPAGSYLY